MSRVIVGCKTLENELNTALLECGIGYDIKWIESGLHDYPQKLHEAVQKILDSSSAYSHALIVSFCRLNDASFCTLF